MPSSYLKPGPWNLREYYFWLNGDGFNILKSVPSIETNVLAHIGAVWKRFSHAIY